MSYTVQSVLLKRDKFSKGEAFKWVRDHGYKASKVDVTPQYFRFRQVPVSDAIGVRYRAIPLGNDGYLNMLYTGPEK